MRLSLGSTLADAAALWRSERDLVVRIAGVFYLLPILALAMLASGMALPDQATPEQVREAVSNFYRDNLVWLLLISVALEFGTLALLKLFLQGGRTVRDLLQSAAVRLLPFVLLGFANGAVMQLGFTLFVVPGIYIFGRTWMMGAAYAAEPGRGLLGGIERGFRLSAGNGWRLALLGFGVAMVIGAGALALLIVAQMLIAAADGAQWAQAVFLVPVAAAATAAYAAFTLVRVAAYRRLAGSSNGM
ncbi:hypothetical protein [Sphingomonas sp. MS122]|uniref:hypothetical protein n=1 Tax=Sphingomonas sp. MS122 TaxID=3412683 RepID=UPI003C2F65B0